MIFPIRNPWLLHSLQLRCAARQAWFKRNCRLFKCSRRWIQSVKPRGHYACQTKGKLGSSKSCRKIQETKIHEDTILYFYILYEFSLILYEDVIDIRICVCVEFMLWGGPMSDVDILAVLAYLKDLSDVPRSWVMRSPDSQRPGVWSCFIMFHHHLVAEKHRRNSEKVDFEQWNRWSSYIVPAVPMVHHGSHRNGSHWEAIYGVAPDIEPGTQWIQKMAVVFSWRPWIGP